MFVLEKFSFNAHLHILRTQACFNDVITERPKPSGDWSNKANTLPWLDSLRMTYKMRHGN